MRNNAAEKVTDAGFGEHCLFHSWHTEDKGSRYANPTFFRNGELVKEVNGKYGPDFSVEFILDFMKRHKDEPMFVYYPMALPHWPMVPTPDSKQWSEKSRRLEESTRYFPDMVEYMDKLVGRVVGGIDSLGLTNNTLVLFYSDNGTHRQIVSRMNGKDVRGGKALPLQTGIRVPLIASWPGTIKPNQTNSQLIDASDFLPTLANIAGAKIPQNWHCDGLSFSSALIGKPGRKRDWCFFWYDPRPGWDKERYGRSIFALDHNYKLFSDGRLFDIKGNGVREVEVDSTDKSLKVKQARTKLGKVIKQMMRPPISDSAKVEFDAFGNPIE